MKYLLRMLHICIVGRVVVYQYIEGFGAFDFVLDHADGGCFGHAELHVDREEGEGIEDELSVFREGRIGEETGRGLHF